MSFQLPQPQPHPLAQAQAQVQAHPQPLSQPYSLAMARWDMAVPTLIFGCLLATTVAICGAMDASTPVQQQIIDETRLIYNDNVVGFNPNDPVASCERAGKRCRVRATAGGIQSALLQH